MSAFFKSASTQSLKNTAPVFTAVPFTVGFWCYPTTTGAIKAMWALADTASAAQFFTLQQSNINQWQISASTAVSEVSASVGTVTANNWFFILGRFISATNRRLSVLQPNGSIVDTQETTSRVPSSIDTMALGALIASVSLRLFDGNIGEFWYTNTDIQPGGAALQESLMRQLAYKGPFSLPYIAKDIVEYHALRQDLISPDRNIDEDYLGAGKIFQNWTNTGGVSVGPHPSLLYDARREPFLLKPSGIQQFFAGMAAGGGIDTTAPRAGTSTGVAVVSGKIAVLNEHKGVSVGVAVDTGRKAVQDAKRSTVTGVAVVAGTSSFRNATWEKAGTSTGVAVVTARDASQDAKRSTVTGVAVVSGKAVSTVATKGASVGKAVDTGREAVQDAKRSTVTGKAVVTGVGTSTSAGSTQPRSGASTGLAIVNARIAWMAEIAGHDIGVAIVNGVATFTDESGGTVATPRFNPLIASVAKLMNR